MGVVEGFLVRGAGARGLMNGVERLGSERWIFHVDRGVLRGTSPLERSVSKGGWNDMRHVKEMRPAAFIN